MVRYELQGNIACLQMDDGKMNAANPTFIAAFEAALDQAEADKAAAVVLSGREGVFSAGFDLKEFQKGPEAALAQVTAGFKLLLRLFEFNRPVIAACDGHGIGLGAFFLLVSDVRIASDGAHKFSLPETRIGMELGAFLGAIVHNRVAPQYITRAAIMSEDMDAKTAMNAGFIDQIVPAGTQMDVAMAVAKQAAALPGIFAFNKKSMRGASLDVMREALPQLKV